MFAVPAYRTPRWFKVFGIVVIALMVIFVTAQIIRTEHAPGWSDGWYQLGREHFLQRHFAEARDALGRCSVLQGIPITERRFECWYIQGQAAEVLGDCDTLMPLYAEFQTMVAEADIPQTWTYPPEGPPVCAEPTTSPEG